MKIIFATGNQNKMKEVHELLPANFEIFSLDDIGVTEEIPETQPSIEGNARQKAEFIYDRFQENVFAEDTGLEVEALNGAPGVKSARYAGDDKNSTANMDLLLMNLKGKRNRSARFKTVIALFLNDEYREFEGVLNGKIIEGKRGRGGFGYDPIFVPEGYNQTLAEMSPQEKNTISHRGKAVQKLISYLNSVE